MDLAAAAKEPKLRCAELLAHLVHLIALGTTAAKALTPKTRGDALTWFSLGWNEAIRALDKLPVEYFDDMRKPLIGRWSGRLRRLLTSLLVPCQDAQSAEEPLPVAWRRLFIELVPFMNDLAAVGGSPPSVLCSAATANVGEVNPAAEPPAPGKKVWLVQALLQLKEDPGISDRELARRCGVSHTTIARDKTISAWRELNADEPPKGQKIDGRIEAESD